MKQIAKKNKQALDLSFVLALFVLARICCPALSNIPLFNMAFTFAYGAAFVVLYLLSVRRIESRDLGLMLTSLFYTVYVLLRGFFAGSGLFARDAFNAYIIIFLTVIYLWIKEKPLATKAFFFRFILVALIFDYVYSIIVLSFDPDASRVSASVGVLEPSPYDILNAVGSFDMVYGSLSVILILLCMRQIMKEKNEKGKITLLVLILALVFIVMAAYGTSLVLLVLALALFFAKKNKAFSALMFILLISILIWHDPIGDWLMELASEITYSESLGKKIGDVGYMLKHFEAAGTYAGEGGRSERMLWSWETFRKYPIFGALGIRGVKIGGHSEFFDMLARFGLVGFAAIGAYLISLYRNIRRELTAPKLKTCWGIIMLVFFVSAVLNPSLYSLQMMPMILMIFLASSYLQMLENKKR